MVYHLHNKYHHHQNTSTNITNCKNREKNCVPEFVLKHSDIDEGSLSLSLSQAQPTGPFYMALSLSHPFPVTQCGFAQCL